MLEAERSWPLADIKPGNETMRRRVDRFESFPGTKKLGYSGGLARRRF